MRRKKRDHSHRRWWKDDPSPPKRRWFCRKSRDYRHQSGFDRHSVPLIVNPWVGLSKKAVLILLIGPTALAILGVLCLDVFPVETATVSGDASVVDGDTLRIGGQHIRLYGIDAPEAQQDCTKNSGGRWRCGHHATVALERKIGWKSVACRRKDIDRYSRIVAICEVDGDDLSAWMVRQGWAVAYTRYSFRYLPDELIARWHDRGIWLGDFMAPEDWRHRHHR